MENSIKAINFETERDIDYLIKIFRKKLDKELGTTNIEKIVEKKTKKFINPTNENPIKIALFLSFLDPTPFQNILKKCTHALKG